MSLRRSFYFFLFSLFLSSEVVVFLQSEKVSWALEVPRGLDQIGIAAITALLFMLIIQAEEHNTRLSHALEEANAVKSQLGDQLRLAESTNSDTRTLRSEIEAIRGLVRSSDVLLHGRMLFAQQNYSQAASLFEDVVRDAPADPAANHWLGLAILRGGEPAKAIPYLKAAARLTLDGEILHALGEAESKIRHTDEAITHFEEALRLGVKNQEAVRIQLAELYRQRDPDKARVILTKVLDDNPYNGNAYVALAELARDGGDVAEAMRLCNLAATKSPKNWGVLTCRAETLLLRDEPGDLEQARKDLDSVRLANPRDFNLYRIEGSWFIKQALLLPEGEERNKFLSRAVTVYSEGISHLRSAFQAPLHAAQSYAYLLLKEPDQAEAAAALAVTRYPSHINNHLALLAALGACSKWSGLQRAARKAKDVGGQAGSIYSRLYEIIGALCAGDRLSDLQQEIMELVKALRAMPLFVPARREWPLIRPSIETRLDALTGADRRVGLAAVQFLSQEITLSQFVDVLERDRK